jgi:hypothetical protein
LHSNEKQCFKVKVGKCQPWFLLISLDKSFFYLRESFFAFKANETETPNTNESSSTTFGSNTIATNNNNNNNPTYSNDYSKKTLPTHNPKSQSRPNPAPNRSNQPITQSKGRNNNSATGNQKPSQPVNMQVCEI